MTSIDSTATVSGATKGRAFMSNFRRTLTENTAGHIAPVKPEEKKTLSKKSKYPSRPTHRDVDEQDR